MNTIHVHPFTIWLFNKKDVPLLCHLWRSILYDTRKKHWHKYCLYLNFATLQLLIIWTFFHRIQTLIRYPDMFWIVSGNKMLKYLLKLKFALNYNETLMVSKCKLKVYTHLGVSFHLFFTCFIASFLKGILVNLFLWFNLF